MIKPISGVLLTAALIAVGNANDEGSDQQPALTRYIALELRGSCDQFNTRLWLVNTHKFKTVMAIVRWRAYGGKDLTEQFYPLPNSIREIGCATEAEIIDARFVDF